ncbi:MAG: phosphoribosylaminoimidazolesuccinocarboxamide synthase [Kiritimatiellia bacterium]
MISIEQIRAHLDNVLVSTDFAGLGSLQRGKVRDCYRQGDRRIIIATDRVSAFDRIIGTIPFKGQVLTQMAAFWFEKTSDIVPNHLIEVPDPNVMVVKECEQLPIEFVVRGYITGITPTSLWYNYERGVRVFCGNVMPDGLKKDQKLEHPILTPTTKHEAHDRNISREEAIAEGLIAPQTFDAAAEICYKLYKRGVEHAASRGLILVDTKYELGWLDGQLVVSDEINTPDSSRYWYADTYETLLASGKEQRKLDKEYVREWLAEHGFRGEGSPPPLPDEVRVEAARRYIEAFEIITGREFVVQDEPIMDRVARAVCHM